MNFYEMLNELESISGSNDKEDYLVYILKKVTNAEKFFRFTFNDQVFGIKEQTFKNAYLVKEHEYNHISDWFATIPKGEPEVKSTVDDLLLFGKTLLITSGNDQMNHITKFFRNLTSLQMKWFCRATLKDLRAGVQVKTVNRAFKRVGLAQIEKFSMQLCDKIDVFDEEAVKKKIKFPCSMECKYDGYRIQAVVQEGICKLTSRRGKDKTQDYPEIVAALLDTFGHENIVLDGELIAKSFQALTRKDDKSTRVFVIFDLLVDEGLKYMNRYDNLMSLVDSNRWEWIKPEITEQKDYLIYINKEKSLATAEHYSADNIGDIQEFYNHLNSRQEEGIIIKLDDRPYERGSRKHMFKCKKVYTADLLIYDYKLGTGKRSGKVSTLCLQDKNRTIFVDVGSGIDDSECEELSNQQWEAEQENTIPDFIGKICEIAYNEITETGSIRFPRFIKIRDDKTEADDLSNTEVRQ